MPTAKIESKRLDATGRSLQADTTDAGRFANSISVDVLWVGGNVALDLRVECVADGEDSAPGTT